MKRPMAIPVVTCFLAAILPFAAAAQDPSEAIYDETRIETFSLSLDPADWDAICNDGTGSGDQWKRATLTWQGETVPGVGVKRSGGLYGVLSDIPKPSIRISFNEFEFANPAGPGTPGRTWHGVNRIKLEAMGPDPAMMRERVAYGIGRAIQAPMPRACHARVLVNGAYKGLYLVEEPVRKDFVRYRWNEDGGNLYKVEAPDSTTYDWKGPDPTSYVPTYFQAETNYPGGDYSDLVQLVNLINNYPADQIRARLDGHINLDGFLRHLALTTVYGDRDDIHHWNSNSWGGGHNHFWYHRASTNRLEIIKWDSDASQGLDGDPYAPAFAEAPLGYKYNLHPLQYWVPTDATAWAAYKAKIVQMLNGPVAAIQSRIDSITSQIRDHVYQDTLKGVDPTWNPDGFTNAEFEAAVVSLKDWWSRRAAYLRNELGAPPPPPPSSDDAAYVSQNIPSTLTAGQSYSVSVTMRNSGTTAWTGSAGYRLNSRGSYDNTTWGVNRIALAAGDSIGPGQMKTFTFTVTAPATPGPYRSRWSMAVGTAPFGATTPDVNVTVAGAQPPPPAGANDAAYVSQIAPSTLYEGQTFAASVTMRNAGTTTWTESAGYRLSSRGPRDNTIWGINRAYLSPGDSIAPGQAHTFSFYVTAPATAGTYTYRWSLVQDGVDWFGEVTTDVSVLVVPGTAASGGQGGDSGGCGATGLEAVLVLGLVALRCKKGIRR